MGVIPGGGAEMHFTSSYLIIPTSDQVVKSWTKFASVSFCNDAAGFDSFHAFRQDPRFSIHLI